MKQPTRLMRAMVKTGQDYRCAEVLRRVEVIGEGADRTRTIYDVTRNFIEELLLVPFSPKDDFCDATSRYFDLAPLKPQANEAAEPKTYVDS